MDCIVHGIINSRTRLSDFHFNYLFMSCSICGILDSQPRIESMLPEVEAQSPNHWTARKFQLP